MSTTETCSPRKKSLPRWGGGTWGEKGKSVLGLTTEPSSLGFLIRELGGSPGADGLQVPATTGIIGVEHTKPWKPLGFSPS